MAGLVNTGVCAPICPSACQEDSYEVKVTNSEWPREAVVDTKLSVWAARNPAMNWVDTIDEVRSSIARVEIYLQELNYQAIAESPKYNFWSFMSSLGGTFGLWTGLSVLGICQVFELVWLLAVSCKRDSDNKVESIDENEQSRPTTGERHSPSAQSQRDQDVLRYEDYDTQSNSSSIYTTPQRY